MAEENPFEDEVTRRRFTAKVFVAMAVIWALPFALALSTNLDETMNEFMDDNVWAFLIAGIVIFVLTALAIVFIGAVMDFPLNILTVLLLAIAVSCLLMSAIGYKENVVLAFSLAPGLLVICCLITAGVSKFACGPIGGIQTFICLLVLVCAACAAVVAPLAVLYPIPALEASLVWLPVIILIIIYWFFLGCVLQRQIGDIRPEETMKGVLVLWAFDMAFARYRWRNYWY